MFQLPDGFVEIREFEEEKSNSLASENPLKKSAVSSRDSSGSSSGSLRRVSPAVPTAPKSSVFKSEIVESDTAFDEDAVEQSIEMKELARLYHARRQQREATMDFIRQNYLGLDETSDDTQPEGYLPVTLYVKYRQYFQAKGF